jgi:hypothetical protein
LRLQSGQQVSEIADTPENCQPDFPNRERSAALISQWPDIGRTWNILLTL